MGREPQLASSGPMASALTPRRSLYAADYQNCNIRLVSFEGVTTLSGSVSSASGSPLAGITLQAYSPDGILRGSTTTAADGIYTLAIGPGTYVLRTSNTEGYLNQWYNDVPVAGHQQSDANPVVVGTSDITGINFTLAPTFSISGSVENRSGAGLSGVSVD